MAITDLHFDYSWDIHRIRGLYTHLISYLIAEPPLRNGANGEYLPSIFKKWHFSDDNKTLTIEISDKFKFNSGKTITVEDVIYSLNQALDKKLKQGAHTDLTTSLCYDNRCNFRKVDKNKVEFKFKSYTNSIISSFTLPELSIFPKEYYQAKNKKAVLHLLPGPYKVVSFEPKVMKLKARKDHWLINEDSPQEIHLHQVKSKEDLNVFSEKYENVIVYSAYSARSKSITSKDLRLKVPPPMITETILLNKFSKELKDPKVRKRIASKLYHSIQSVNLKTDFTTSASQYFPKYSLAHLSEGVSDLYFTNLDKEKKDTLDLYTYEELGFDEKFDLIKKKAESLGLYLNLKVLKKKKFFHLMDDEINEREHIPTFYYFSGVGGSNPLFEITYMVERSNGKKYSDSSITQLLKKARVTPDKEQFKKMVREIHKKILSSHYMVPVRHSSPTYHYKGAFLPSDDYFSGGLDFWAWRKSEPK